MALRAPQVETLILYGFRGSLSRRIPRIFGAFRKEAEDGDPRQGLRPSEAPGYSIAAALSTAMVLVLASSVPLTVTLTPTIPFTFSKLSRL